MPFMSDRPDQETDDPLYADRRNFYKVEKWSRDGLRIELVLYAGKGAPSSGPTNTGRASATKTGEENSKRSSARAHEFATRLMGLPEPRW
jgi:hypothetical protein